MTDLPSGVQRLWRLSKPEEDCIGAIVSGYVPDLTSPALAGHFVAYISVSLCGTRERRVHADGRVFFHQPIGRLKHFVGAVSETLNEALEDLDAMKQKLISEGWTEIQLDPVEDPD